MFDINANFSRKEVSFEPQNCTVDKIVHLSGAEYDKFASSMLEDRDFIRDNVDVMRHDSDGKLHALLVVGEGRPDGILIDSSGYDYARYAAHIPSIGDTLPVMRYPALAELNHKLERLVDHIAEQAVAEIETESAALNITDLEDSFLITLDEPMLDTVKDMLSSFPEIGAAEVYNGDLVVYTLPIPPGAEFDITDPTVSKTDMYAYGYSWDGMIPLGQEKALELHDLGYQVYRLYTNDAEGAIDSREEIMEYDSMFGVEYNASDKEVYSENIQIFIANSREAEPGKASGEWLKLPADSMGLQQLLTRIGVQNPSADEFTVTAIRLPFENLQYNVSKYDSIDDINTLAAFLEDMEDYEINRLKAILTSGSELVGDSAADIVNLLYEDNMDAFRLVDAKDTNGLGQYYRHEKPDEMSFSEYGSELKREEHGTFTEWGYVYCRYDKLSDEYGKDTCKQHHIVDGALHKLQVLKNERERFGRHTSVREKIKASQNRPSPLEAKDPKQKSRAKVDPEL